MNYNFEQIKNDLFKDLNKDIEWLKKRTIFLTIHGSIAYGLNTPESDIDLRGVCIPEKQYFIGFNKKFEQFIKNDPDGTIFDIKKFFNLAVQNNPNCLEIIYTDPEFHIIKTELGQTLVDNRNKFLSKQAKERFFGYSRAQAHRIRQHRSWVLNKLEEKPTRQHFGLPEKPQIEKNQFDAVKSLIQNKLETWVPDFEPFSNSQKIYLNGKVADILSEMKIKSDDKWAAADRSSGLDDNLIYIIKKEKEFENKIEEYKNYQRWKINRNPKRAELEAKFGFDLKHATQLVRLLRMGKEILESGRVQVYRANDREELMAIKTGAWTYEQLIEYADKLEKEVEIAYQNSKLPNQPDINYLDNLCIQLIESSLQ